MRNMIILLALCNNLSYGGFNGLTHHSRANCVNNESISWDMTRYHRLRVNSIHIDNNKVTHHNMNSGIQDTWRLANVHWGEGADGDHWVVAATHFEYGCNGETISTTDDQVEDCSIYDGWWDTKDKPEGKPCKESNKMSYSPYAKVLLNYKSYAKAQVMSFKNNTDPSSTHLRLLPGEIKLAFPYIPLHVKRKTTIGFAPVGMYSKKGWTGMKEFFESKELGVCALEVNKNSSITFKKKNINDSVNEEPAEFMVDGDPDSGYLYEMFWQHAPYRYDFACAKKVIDSDMKKKMTDYAQTISDT